MASGILGQSSPTAATNTTIYTVPAATVASFAVSFCNRSSTAATIRLAIAASGTPTNAEWLLYDVQIPGNSALERTALVANAAENVVVYTSTADVSVSVYGYEG